MSSPEDMFFQSSEEMVDDPDPGPLETDTGQVTGQTSGQRRLPPNVIPPDLVDSDVEDDEEPPPGPGPGTDEDMDTDKLTTGTVIGKSKQ